MKFLKIFVVAFTIQLISLPSAISGGFLFGKDWSAQNYDFKVGYVLGVIDALSTANLQRKDGLLFITNCIPKAVDSNQLVKIVEKYIEKTPEELHYNMDFLVMKAVTKAFNCQESKQN